MNPKTIFKICMAGSLVLFYTGTALGAFYNDAFTFMIMILLALALLVIGAVLGIE